MRDSYHVFDTHTHLGTARHSGRSTTAGELLRSMDEHGVDRFALAARVHRFLDAVGVVFTGGVRCEFHLRCDRGDGDAAQVAAIGEVGNGVALGGRGRVDEFGFRAGENEGALGGGLGRCGRDEKEDDEISN